MSDGLLKDQEQQLLYSGVSASEKSWNKCRSVSGDNAEMLQMSLMIILFTYFSQNNKTQ